MERIFFSRLQLYTLVWRFPIVIIAKSYEISPKGIKDACYKMNIPLPGSKELVRVKYDRSIVPLLSENYKGSSEIEILKKKYQSEFRKMSKLSPLKRLIKELKSDLNAPLHFTGTLLEPYEIIDKTLKCIEKTEQNNEIGFSAELLYLNVEAKNVPRALLFLNALIKLLHYRGHSFKSSSCKTGTVHVNGEIKIDIDLREGLKKTRTKPSKGFSRYNKTGSLILKVKRNSFKKEWRDGKVPLEDRLIEVVAQLEIIAISEQKYIKLMNSYKE